MNICRFKHVYKKGKKGFMAETKMHRKDFPSATK